MRTCSVVDAYLDGVLEGDMADTAVMHVLARRYGIQIVVFMPPKTDAMDSAQGRKRTVLRGWHKAPEGIGGRPKILCVLATYLNCQHFEPVVPFSGCTHQVNRFQKITEEDREGYCPALGVQYTSNAQHRQVCSFQLMRPHDCMTYAY